MMLKSLITMRMEFVLNKTCVLAYIYLYENT